MKNGSHTTLDSALYGYSVGNQRLAFTDAAGTYLRFTYDPLGQLTVARATNVSGVLVAGETKGYKYDAAWNLDWRTNNTVATDFSVDGKNQFTTVAADTYVQPR